MAKIFAEYAGGEEIMEFLAREVAEGRYCPLYPLST